MKRRGRIVAAAALVVVALGATGLVLQQVRPATLPWNRSPLIAAAYLPTWDDPASTSLASATAHGVTEVSPVWATVHADGTLAVNTPPAGEAAALRRPGLRIVPTIQDLQNGQWQGVMMASLITDPTARARHVQAVIDEAVAGGWAGVDIDYEGLPPLAGAAFTSFLGALADQLHTHGMVLSVDVPARTSDGGDPDTLAYPYQLIGRVADEVRVMAYDYSYATGSPGPVAPLAWVKAVVAYTVARVPKDKVMLGLATYGYDWVGRSGTDIGSADAPQLAARQRVEPQWDSRSASSTFTYQLEGRTHTVWYEDSRSVAAKADVAVSNELHGVALWRLGGEDPRIWTTVVATATEGSGK